MRFHKFRQGRKRTGVAAIEMAFVAPFVFLIVFGSIEFARMMMIKQALTNACREGCRHATLATTNNDDQAEDYMRRKLNSIAGSHKVNKFAIDFTPSFETRPAAGTRITASVEVQCADISWLPPMFFGDAKIRSAASMVRE